MTNEDTEQANRVLNSLADKPYPGSHAWTAARNAIASALATARHKERERCIEAVLSQNLPYGRDNELLNEIADAIRSLFDAEEKTIGV